MRRIVLSNSQRWKATGCKRRFYFQEIEGLRPKVEKLYFRAGRYWHKFQELLNRSLLFGEYPNFKDVSYSICNLMDKELHTSDFSPEEWEEILDMKETLKFMMLNYEDNFKKFADRYDVLGVEVPFRLKFAWNRRGTGDIHPKLSISLIDIKSDDRPNNEFTGVVDVILREKDTGTIWAGEYKTTGKSVEHYESGMAYNFQRFGYSIATKLLAKKRKWGEFVGSLYMVTEKKRPTYPKMNQCPRCKGTKIVQTGKTKGQACELCDRTGYGKISLRSNLTTNPEAIMTVYNRYPHLNKPYFDKWRENKFKPYLQKMENAFPDINIKFDKYAGKERMADFAIDTMNTFSELRKRKGLKKEKCIRDYHFSKCNMCPMKLVCDEDTPIVKESNYKVVEPSEWPYEFEKYITGSDPEEFKIINRKEEEEDPFSTSFRAKDENVQKSVDKILGF